MKAWIYSIVGIVILTVLLDLVLEEGETKKYIKGIFALLAVIVIASPIPRILNGNFDFTMGDETIGETVVFDETYLKSLNARRLENNEISTTERLKANSINGLTLNGILDPTTTEYKVMKVVVSKEIGIKEDEPNIYNTELILKIVSEGMRADKEVIEINV